MAQRQRPRAAQVSLGCHPPPGDGSAVLQAGHARCRSPLIGCGAADTGSRGVVARGFGVCACPPLRRGGLFPPSGSRFAVRLSVRVGAGGGSHRHLGGRGVWRGKTPPPPPPGDPHFLSRGRSLGLLADIWLAHPHHLPPPRCQVPHALRATPRRTPPPARRGQVHGLPCVPACPNPSAPGPPRRRSCLPAGAWVGGVGGGGGACSRRRCRHPCRRPNFAPRQPVQRGVTRRSDRHRPGRLLACSPGASHPPRPSPSPVPRP